MKCYLTFVEKEFTFNQPGKCGTVCMVYDSESDGMADEMHLSPYVLVLASHT